MWKTLILLLALAPTLFAQEQPTAYQALRTIGHGANRDLVNHVISIRGTEGNPQPAVWTILLDDPRARGGVREIEVQNDRVISERTPLRESVASSLGPIIDTSKLNLDSSGAYTLAEQAAASSHITVAGADYTLHGDEHGNPIWVVALRRAGGEAAGKIFIGANHGTIMRTEGLFAGGDRVTSTDVETTEDADDDDGDVNPIKRGIKDAFKKFGRDVKQDFHKVRRSFTDFFEDK